ncbi:MAG: type II secretion system protein N [Pseudomonadota bacterium]|nr:type II secretion system protein N [Pseudomonadota bacterium]
MSGWIRGKRLWLLATLVLLATLLADLPATLVWQSLKGHLPTRVELTGLRGTLWQGEVARMQVAGIDQGALSWDWQPGGLLRGEVVLDLSWQPRKGQVRALVRAGLGSITLEQVNGYLDAASMAQVNKAPFVLQGDWLLDISELQLRDFREVSRATGRIGWQNAGGGLPNPLALGDLGATLSQDNGWLVMTLADNGGPLGLQGTARWQPAASLKLDTRLQARPEADSSLAEGLSLLGRPDAEGWIRWRANLQ